MHSINLCMTLVIKSCTTLPHWNSVTSLYLIGYARSTVHGSYQDQRSSLKIRMEERHEYLRYASPQLHMSECWQDTTNACPISSCQDTGHLCSPIYIYNNIAKPTHNRSSLIFSNKLSYLARAMDKWVMVVTQCMSFDDHYLSKCRFNVIITGQVHSNQLSTYGKSKLGNLTTPVIFYHTHLLF